jgi:hypothetical protein
VRQAYGVQSLMRDVGRPELSTYTTSTALFCVLVAVCAAPSEAPPLQDRQPGPSDQAEKAPTADEHLSYPPLNRSLRMEGRVLVEVTVNQNGRPYEVAFLASEASSKSDDKTPSVEGAITRFRESARYVAIAGRYGPRSHDDKKRISVVYGIEPCSPPKHYDADYMVTLCVPVPAPRIYE